MPTGPTGWGIEGERDHNMVVAAVRRATAANAEIIRRFMGSSVSQPKIRQRNRLGGSTAARAKMRQHQILGQANKS
jgi:hypothetical protein